jgi:hypothetical protein
VGKPQALIPFPVNWTHKGDYRVSAIGGKMFRVPKSLVMLLLILGAISVVPLAHSGTGPADIVFKGPIFQYTLRKDHDPAVCKHMLQVFNDNFSHPWDAPELTDSAYSADSKYAFPVLPGVLHSARTTFEMAFTAQPASTEFSAIHWNEGRAIPGGGCRKDMSWRRARANSDCIFRLRQRWSCGYRNQARAC